MSDRLPSLTPREVLQALHRAGFDVRKQRGSHAHLQHRDDSFRFATVAMHPRTRKRGTLFGILRQAGLNVEEFKRYL